MTAGSGDHPREGASSGDTGGRFLQPAAGRILTVAGLAGDPPQLSLRRHGLAARRIVIGRQILKIVAKGRSPD